MTQSKFFLNFYFVMELKNPLIPQLLFATYDKQKKQRANYSGKIKQHPPPKVFSRYTKLIGYL